MKLLLLTLLSLASATLGQRNPNPCAGVTGVDRFANDWASCADYFWCNSGVAVPNPRPCPEGMGFDETLQGCTVDQGGELCDPCPADLNIAVADSTDIECRAFAFCVEGARVVATNSPCGVGTRFNRVTGQCDLPANVHCAGQDGGGGVEGECAPGQTGDINSIESCASFIHCINGEPVGVFECSPGLHFHPTNNVCDLPANLPEPCTDALRVAKPNAPVAPGIAKSEKVDDVVNSLINRLLRRLQ